MNAVMAKILRFLSFILPGLRKTMANDYRQIDFKKIG